MEIVTIRLDEDYYYIIFIYKNQTLTNEYYCKIYDKQFNFIKDTYKLHDEITALKNIKDESILRSLIIASNMRKQLKIIRKFTDNIRREREKQMRKKLEFNF